MCFWSCCEQLEESHNALWLPREAVSEIDRLVRVSSTPAFDVAACHLHIPSLGSPLTREMSVLHLAESMAVAWGMELPASVSDLPSLHARLQSSSVSFDGMEDCKHF